MQHDYNLANNNGLGFRSDLNQVLLAIMTNNSGNTEPTATEAGMWWYDTLTGIIKQRNAANDGWAERFDMAGGRLAPLASPTFTGAVNLPGTTYIAGSPVARTEAPVFSGNAVFESLTAAMTVSLPASTTIGAVSAAELSCLDGVTSPIQSQLNAKQAALVSGTSIKTINEISLLGSGNIDLTVVQNPSAVFANSQTFNGSGTFVVPAGVTKVFVMVCAGGGGGGGSGTEGNIQGPAAGGGGSGFVTGIVTVTPGSSVTVTVGAGGAGGNANGGNGGNSAFGTFMVEGASGAIWSYSTYYGVPIPGRGTGSNGGTHVKSLYGDISASGHGGSGAKTLGPAGRPSVGTGSSGADVGEGGAGGWSLKGGKGYKGQVIVYW